MRIFICADIEGVAAVTGREETGPAGFDWGRARERMTREVLAAIEGARAAGADGFVVADSHGTGLNLIPEMFPDDVELVRGWPRPLMMMEGVERGPFACAFLLGHHAGAGWLSGTTSGGLAHSFSSRLIQAISVDGRPMPECLLNAAIAGQFGIPTTLITGDDACIAEALTLFSGIETVTTKRSLGFLSSAVLAPSLIEAGTREAAERAVRAATATAPWRLEGPLAVEVEFKAALLAETLCYLPQFERLGPSRVGFRADQPAEIAQTIMFMLMTLPSLL